MDKYDRHDRYDRMITMIGMIGMSGMIVKEEARNDMLWTRRLF